MGGGVVHAQIIGWLVDPGLSRGVGRLEVERGPVETVVANTRAVR